MLVPKQFESPGGRVYQIGQCHSDGGLDGQDTWPIYLSDLEVGSICYSSIYRKPLSWSASLTKLVWTGPPPPAGIGFDVAAFEAAEECLGAWSRNADDVLDWRDGKQVRSVYSKTGFYQRDVATELRAAALAVYQDAANECAAGHVPSDADAEGCLAPDAVHARLTKHSWWAGVTMDQSDAVIVELIEHGTLHDCAADKPKRRPRKPPLVSTY